MKRSDTRKLPMIWRLTLGITFVIATIFLKYLTEVFHLTRDSWTLVLGATIYVLAVFGTLRCLRLKLSN